MDAPKKPSYSVTTQDLQLVARALGIEVEDIKRISIELQPKHSLTGAHHNSIIGLCYCGGDEYRDDCCP